MQICRGKRDATTVHVDTFRRSHVACSAQFNELEAPMLL